MNEFAGHIVLMGMRASGKTTIGRMAADRMQRRFVDLDDRTRSRFSESSIQVIWSKHGEAAWRTGETEALREALAERPCVLALGGGTPMIPAARAMLEQARKDCAITVVYLRCSPEALQLRLDHQAGDRTSLTGRGVVEEVHDVLASREAAYLALADAQLDTGVLSVQHAVDALMKL